MVAQGEPPEVTSAEFWLGPSTASFMASAAELTALSGLIIGMLGGHAAVEAAMAVNWPAPTGELARLANVPHMLWMATVAGELAAAAGLITTTAEAFEAARLGTPTPLEVGENQTEHMVLNATNLIGQNTPAIIFNRMNYGRMWVTGVANKASYAAASAAGVQAIPPVPPPPPTAVPVSGAGMPGGPGDNPGTEVLSSAGGAPMQMMQSFLPTLMALPSQAGQVLGGGNGLTQLPQQALGQLTSLSSQFGSFNPGEMFDAAAASEGADWALDTPAAGGPVAASLAGPTGGVGGVGGVGALGSAALRSPVSWSSAVNAATATATPAEAPASRLAEARAATTAPASTAGMGRGGMMMAPLAAAAGRQDENQASTSEVADRVFTRTAAAFRTPEGLPTITGFGGVQDKASQEVTT